MNAQRHLLSGSARAGHRWARTMAIGVGALLPVLALVGTGVGAPAGATTGPTAASHWGAFFGNGNAHNDTELSPTSITLPGHVVEVATSNSTQYALLADGAVYAWGLGGDGELGSGGTADSFTTPVRVHFPTGVKIASLPTDAMPYNTGLAVDTTGRAWGWGDNSAGQLCTGKTSQYLTPVRIPLTKVTELAGAGDHALYVSHGTLFACGGNLDGDLGDGTTTASRTPVKVPALAGHVVRAVVASYHDSGALLGNGHYFDWGYDAQGQLGDGKVGVSSSVPVLVKLPHPVTQVVEGGSYLGNGQTLVMLSDGSLRSWGDDQDGQLGDGKTVNEPSPVTFAAPAGVTYQFLASGAVTSYAVSTTGEVYAWGGSTSGQVGNGKTGNQLTPVAVEPGVTGISSTALDVATS
jgi:alpha-tubulin suppressor-like RCC1 family protein